MISIIGESEGQTRTCLLWGSSAMSNTTLTDVRLRSLKPEPNRRVEIWDAQLPGFGLRVSPTGTKSFILLYRIHGRPRRMTLGRYPQLSLADARVQAREALNIVDSGADPQADLRAKVEPGELAPSKAEGRARHRIDSVVAEFVQRHCLRHNRASTAHETERVLRAHLVSVWPTRDIREIGKSDILRLLDDLVDAGKPSAANHAFAAIRKFFNWCVERGLLDISPCLGIKMPTRATPRSRVLEDGELARVWNGSDPADHPFGTIVRLLILTGQRRSEVGAMRWADLDLENALWNMPPEMNKSDRAHSVPLTQSAIAFITATPRLSETYLFPSLRSPDRCFSGYSKCKARLDTICGVTEWTLHDLRRTVATGLAGMAVAPHVVEKLLNHTSGTFSGVAGVYNRFQYAPEMRAALDQWEARVLALAA